MISVIIPTYKSPKVLDLCLESAITGQYRYNQIIVVVDGFYDLNYDVLYKWREHIDVLNLETNQGLCRATNLGVYNSTSDKILIVNDDNVFPRGWDNKLEEFYNPNWVISPNQIEPRPSMFNQFIIQDLGTDPESFDLSKFWDYCSKSTISLKEEIDNTGSTLPIFMNRNKFLALGGWDENYPQGMVADWDFFLKCNIMGLNMKRIYNCPFYHFTSLSVKDELREQAEIKGHRYSTYKWGDFIKHDTTNNTKYI